MASVAHTSATAASTGHKYYGQGVAVNQSSNHHHIVYVAVSKSDTVKGTSVWHELPDESDITWKLVTNNLEDNQFSRTRGDYELVMFRDEQDSQRQSYCVDVRNALSNHVTFEGWGVQPTVRSVKFVP